MSVRIITDSASDISQEWAKEWNITVLPLKVRFGEEEFLDGVTLSNREFYERLIETDEIPKTSQITPFEYSSNFEKAVKAGEQVVCFCLSSGVSRAPASRRRNLREMSLSSIRSSSAYRRPLLWSAPCRCATRV